MQHRSLIVSYGILLLSCGLFCRGESEASTQENERKIFTINDLLEEKQLDIMEWEDGPGFIDKLLEKRVPVLLKNSPASQWAAVKTWNPKHMAEKASKATGVKIYNKRKFPVGCCELNPMSQKDFWERVEKSQESGEYMYFNGQAHILGHALEKEIGPKFFLEREGRMTNVWMGNKGATAPLHHDPFENFFVQVYGTKKFYLFPPSEHRNLYVHPKTHAMHRHAQVDIDTPDLEKYPELAHARGFTLLVEPGTVFYLPPFWFHQVESLTDTISINTWYPSTVVEQMGEAWDENMPFDPEWSDVKFVTAVKYVISKMISTVYPGEDSVKQFIGELVRTRFVPLYKNSSAVDLLTGVNTVKDPHLQVHLREQQELDATIFAPSLTDQEFCGGPPDFIEGEKPVLKEFKRAIKRLSSKFSNAPKDLRDVQMEDYIEDMIGQTVGDKKVFKFLQECF